MNRRFVQTLKISSSKNGRHAQRLPLLCFHLGTLWKAFSLHSHLTEKLEFPVFLSEVSTFLPMKFFWGKPGYWKHVRGLALARPPQGLWQSLYPCLSFCSKLIYQCLIVCLFVCPSRFWVGWKHFQVLRISLPIPVALIYPVMVYAPPGNLVSSSCHSPSAIGCFPPAPWNHFRVSSQSQH